MTTATMWRRLIAAWTADLGPAFPFAACRGAAPTFDGDYLPGETPADRADRHRAAARTCNSCPELAPCRALIDQLPPRAAGIWGGLLVADGNTSDPNQLQLEETA